MSQDLLYTYKTGFDRAVRRTVEVVGGKLRPYVDMATGDLFRSDGVYQRTSGGGLPNKKTTRFGNSPVSEDDYSRRRVSRSDYDDGQFMDWSDVVRIGTDLKAQKLVSMNNKFKRNEDVIIQQAALGTAQGGDNGETTTVFDTDNIISAAEGASGSTGFNYTKFLATLELFGENDVDIESTPPTFVVSWAQWRNMMDDDKFINLDYAPAHTVGKGTFVVRNYMGCDFVISNIVPWMNTAGTGFNVLDTDLNTTAGKWTDTDTTDVRACFAFCKDAILLEVNPDIQTEIEKRGDKGFNWYAYMKMGLGAVRMEEEKVIAVPCDESP